MLQAALIGGFRNVVRIGPLVDNLRKLYPISEKVSDFDDLGTVSHFHFLLFYLYIFCFERSYNFERCSICQYNHV